VSDPRLERVADVGRKQNGRQVVEAVKHLDVVVVDEQLPSISHRRLVALVRQRQFLDTVRAAILSRRHALVVMHHPHLLLL